MIYETILTEICEIIGDLLKISIHVLHVVYLQVDNNHRLGLANLK